MFLILFDEFTIESINIGHINLEIKERNLFDPPKVRDH
jgi:hypothetical protein